ncbi:MAG: ATPase, T2SS/T4P/T4SS family, partial [Deltaproteobacteria bacterium]
IAPSTQAAATLNIAPSVVDAVLQSHKATPAAPGEPTPVGREFATLLGEIVAEASSNGASAPSDRVADGPTRAKIRAAVESAARARTELPSGVTVERLVRDAVAELAGTGAFEVALGEGDVTTVVVEAGGRVFVGRGDAIGPSPFWFSSPEAVIRVIDRLLHSAGASRGSSPVVDVSLNDGARLLAVLPPVSPSGPTAVYERAARSASILDLAARQMLSVQAASTIAVAVASRRNIIVTGPRGSGRTTLLGALVASASLNDRCLVVERTRELAASLPATTTIAANGDWVKAVDLALRLRPQRIAFGDISEPGAAAFVSMLGTGSEGMFCVADGPSPALALNRLASLAAAGGAFTRDEALARLAHTRPLVVHMARLGDGVCHVVSIGDARPSDTGLRVEDAFTLHLDGVNSSGKIEATLVAGPRAS